MLRHAFALFIGVLSAQYLPELPDGRMLAVLVVLMLLSGWQRCWWLFALLVGLTWTIAIANNRLAQRLPENLAGKDLIISGQVLSLPDGDSKALRFDFAPDASELKLPEKIRLSWYQATMSVKAGQYWRFNVRLKPPHGLLNPGGFDYERWALSENIGATGYIRPYPKPVLLEEGSAWRDINVLRQLISDYLAQHQHSALLTALTIGDGQGISQEQWDVFRKTGTTHLIVISGSHIALVAGLVYWLVVKLWAYSGVLRYSAQKIAAIIAGFSGVFYSVLAGFSIPTQRAAIMLCVYMWALQQQRVYKPLSVLAIAVVAVVLFDPFAVFAPGFWLSFLAVFIIVYCLSGRLKQPGLVIETLTVNWASFVALTPIVLFYFQQFSLTAPIANLIAVPFISVIIVPLALIAVGLLFIWLDVAEWLLTQLDTLLAYGYQGLTTIAKLPYTTLTLAQPTWPALLLALPAVLWLLAPKGIPMRGLALVLLLPLFFAQRDKPSVGEFNVTVLDVGQGLAVAIETAEHWLIYDTGAKFSSDSDIGLSVLIPFLRLHGVTALDGLVISHGDNDHIGGSASLLAEIPARQLYTSVPELLSTYQPELCRSGQHWQWEGVDFTMLASPERRLGSENNQSCVLKVSNGQYSVLLTGDIEAEAETWLVEHQREQLAATVLLAPHHGSKTSSTTPFLLAVQAEAVIISAGYHNSFGHPHESVVKRYQQLGIRAVNTADKGALSLYFTQQRYALISQRESQARYWHNTQQFQLTTQEE